MYFILGYASNVNVRSKYEERMEIIVKKYSILLVICIMFLGGCSNSSIKQAQFTNLKPSISLEGKEYIVSKDVVDKNTIAEQIAKVTTISNIVSYSEKDNPYKKIGKIYKIKGENIEKAIAVEINDSIYLAKIDSNLNQK